MKRLKLLLRQFSLLNALRIFIVDSIRKLFDPFRRSSYSQTGEDLIIDYYLDNICAESLYYVDIGCSKPFDKSNTMRLYQRGASGLAIDANPTILKAYAKNRPRDICICACVSDRQGIGLLTVAKQVEMSSISPEFANEFLKEDSVQDRVPVELVTAQHLFDIYNVPNDFALLSIDVEGHDLEVLRSFDLQMYCPRLIVIEMHDGSNDINSVFNSDVYSYLKGHGYRLCAFATINGYFIREN